MAGDTKEHSDEQNGDEADADASSQEAPVAVEDVENVGDMSVEINVEELIAKVESADADVTDEERDIRKKLDEIKAQKDDQLDSTYNFNLDDDL